MKLLALVSLIAWALRACTHAQLLSSTLLNDISFPALLDATTEGLIIGLECGIFTSVGLVNAYVARINEVNGTLHAVAQLNPDALTIAQFLDDERTNGIVRGPLHGNLILIKINVATKQSHG